VSVTSLMAGGAEYLSDLVGQEVHLVTGSPPVAVPLQARVHELTAEELAAAPNAGAQKTVRISLNHLPAGVLPAAEDRILFAAPDPAWLPEELSIHGLEVVRVQRPPGAVVLEVRG